MADNRLGPRNKNALLQALPMEGRATFLPFQDTLPGSVMNQRSFALPGVIAGAVNAFTAPGRAYSGSDPNFNPEEEAANFAMLTLGNRGMGEAKPSLTAGLEKARENNTFKYGQNDTGNNYGRGMGFPQRAGTPPEKLFSNFADNIKNPEMKNKFREDVFQRALKTPSQYKNDTFDRSVIPFRDGMYVVVDAAGKGNTRVQVMKDNTPVAAARLNKGLLDSIGVHESAKGQQLGSDLLQFIHDNKIGNVLEVPDRSPGFIKIQRELVKKLELTE
jgi:hypothetical protein